MNLINLKEGVEDLVEVLLLVQERISQYLGLPNLSEANLEMRLIMKT